MFSRDAIAELAGFAEQHRIKPVVAEVAFNDAIAALEALQDQAELGRS